MKELIPLFILIFAISSCELEVEDRSVEGMRPIYVTPSADSIYAKGPQDMDKLGKIVYVDPYIFINERFKGIHVIDNSNPSTPENIEFWQIIGNTDFTIEDQYLYAENSRDLYTIDISDINNILLVDEIRNVYSQGNSELLAPENYFGEFECVDGDLGIVVDWVLDTLLNPNCSI